MYFCIYGRVTDCRCNTRSTIRQLTVRTVHVWVYGSTIVGETHAKNVVGPRLSVNTSRCVCGRVCGCVCGGGVFVSVCVLMLASAT